MAEIKIPVGGGPNIRGPSSYTIRLPALTAVSEKQAAFGESRRAAAVTAAAELVTRREGGGFLKQPPSVRAAYIAGLEKAASQEKSARAWIDQAVAPRDLALAANKVALTQAGRLKERQASLAKTWAASAAAAAASSSAAASGGGAVSKAGSGRGSAG